MGNPGKGWTPERRKKQSKAIRPWKPWSRSTRSKSRDGKAALAGNAWAGGEWLKLRDAIQDFNQAMRVLRNRLGR